MGERPRSCGAKFSLVDIESKFGHAKLMVPTKLVQLASHMSLPIIIIIIIIIIIALT
jgi:hypothetical protein